MIGAEDVRASAAAGGADAARSRGCRGRRSRRDRGLGRIKPGGENVAWIGRRVRSRAGTGTTPPRHAGHRPRARDTVATSARARGPVAREHADRGGARGPKGVRRQTFVAAGALALAGLAADDKPKKPKLKKAVKYGMIGVKGRPSRRSSN